MKKYIQYINKECNLFVRGTLETESIMDMILAFKTEKNKKRLLRQSPGSAMSLDCLYWSLDHSCAPGHRMATAGSKQHPAAPAHCSCTFHCHRLHLHVPCEKTQLPPTASSAQKVSHKQPLTWNTYKSNLPLGFQFSVWICSPLSLHQREAGSSF